MQRQDNIDTHKRKRKKAKKTATSFSIRLSPDRALREAFRQYQIYFDTIKAAIENYKGSLPEALKDSFQKESVHVDYLEKTHLEGPLKGKYIYPPLLIFPPEESTQANKIAWGKTMKRVILMSVGNNGLLGLTGSGKGNNRVLLVDATGDFQSTAKTNLAYRQTVINCFTSEDREKMLPGTIVIAGLTIGTLEKKINYLVKSMRAPSKKPPLDQTIEDNSVIEGLLQLSGSSSDQEGVIELDQVGCESFLASNTPFDELSRSEVTEDKNEVDAPIDLHRQFQQAQENFHTTLCEEVEHLRYDNVRLARDNAELEVQVKVLEEQLKHITKGKYYDFLTMSANNDQPTKINQHDYCTEEQAFMQEWHKAEKNSQRPLYRGRLFGQSSEVNLSVGIDKPFEANSSAAGIAKPIFKAQRQLFSKKS